MYPQTEKAEMKITVGQLRRIINETVREALLSEAVTKEEILDHGRKIGLNTDSVSDKIDAALKADPNCLEKYTGKIGAQNAWVYFVNKGWRDAKGDADVAKVRAAGVKGHDQEGEHVGTGSVSRKGKFWV